MKRCCILSVLYFYIYNEMFIVLIFICYHSIRYDLNGWNLTFILIFFKMFIFKGYMYVYVYIHIYAQKKTMGECNVQRLMLSKQSAKMTWFIYLENLCQRNIFFMNLAMSQIRTYWQLASAVKGIISLSQGWKSLIG